MNVWGSPASIPGFAGQVCKVHLSHSALTGPHTKGICRGLRQQPRWQNPSLGMVGERAPARPQVISPREMSHCCHCSSRVRPSQRVLESVNEPPSLTAQEIDTKEIKWSRATQGCGREASGETRLVLPDFLLLTCIKGTGPAALDHPEP